jgi:hypothetical protein
MQSDHGAKKKLSRFNPGGLATAIGSLPFSDPSEAIKLIRRYLPAIPHWPQLPRRGMEEHFVFQFLHPLVDTGLLVVQDDTYFFDMSQTNWPNRLTEFYTNCLAAEEGDPSALENFLPPKEAAIGFHEFLADMQRTGAKGIKFFKGQIVGPLTAGLQLKDERGRLAYYHGDLRDVIVRTLALNARCQAAALTQFGCPAIIFVDDPAIRAYGSRHHLTLTREMILEDLNTIFGAVLSENALIGVHSCEALDWSLLLESELQILSLDTYRYGDSLICYASQVKNFLESDGVVAWGIVPTLDDPFAEEIDTLIKRLQRLWSGLVSFGLDLSLILQQSMITPACGTGLLSVEQAQRIYKLTSAVSAEVMEKWTSIKL